MAKKELTHCWIKGKQIFPSVKVNKGAYAYDLLQSDEIKMTKKESQRLFDSVGLRHSTVSTYDIAAEILESKGWSWRKFKDVNLNDFRTFRDLGAANKFKIRHMIKEVYPEHVIRF